VDELWRKSQQCASFSNLEQGLSHGAVQLELLIQLMRHHTGDRWQFRRSGSPVVAHHEIGHIGVHLKMPQTAPALNRSSP